MADINILKTDSRGRVTLPGTFRKEPLFEYIIEGDQITLYPVKTVRKFPDMEDLPEGELGTDWLEKRSGSTGINAPESGPLPRVKPLKGSGDKASWVPDPDPSTCFLRCCFWRATPNWARRKGRPLTGPFSFWPKIPVTPPCKSTRRNMFKGNTPAGDPVCLSPMPPKTCASPSNTARNREAWHSGTAVFTTLVQVKSKFHCF